MSVIQVTKEDIEAVREWISKTPHVPSHYDDDFLAAFIRGCKGSIQKTKLVLENFSSVVTKYPAMYGNLDMFQPKVKDFLDMILMFPLSRKLEDDISVYFCSVSKSNVDPNKLDVAAYFTYEFAAMLVRLKKNQHGSGKVLFVIDGNGITLGHMRTMTPTFIKSWLAILDNMIPMRLNGIHTFNMPVFMEWIFNLIKSLIKAKIAQRIFIHSAVESVFEHVPKEMFPKDYGGCDEDSQVSHDKWRKTVEGYNEMLLKEQAILQELDKYRPKTKDEEMIGTFKKLAVD